MIEKNLEKLVINKVENKAVYDYLVEANLINEDELYLVGGESDTIEIIDDIQNEIYLLGADQEGNIIKRNLGLKMLNGLLIGTAQKVEHKLVIGDVEFDGSEDITVPVYNGEMIID